MIPQIPELRPGDVILYAHSGFFNLLIRFKTCSGGETATHVEVFACDGATVASRNGKGVALYPFDPSGIRAILRPRKPFDHTKAMAAFWVKYNGLHYGWLDLGKFINKNWPSRGLICSQFADLHLNEGGFYPFSKRKDPGAVSPADYAECDDDDFEWIYDANEVAQAAAPIAA